MAIKIMPDGLGGNPRGRRNAGYEIIAAVPDVSRGAVNGHMTYIVAGVDKDGNAVTWWAGFQPDYPAPGDTGAVYSSGNYFPCYAYPDARGAALANMVERAGISPATA